MTALLQTKLLQVIEDTPSPDAKTLRDFTAVLKELTALRRDLLPQTDDVSTGVIILPEVPNVE